MAAFRIFFGLMMCFSIIRFWYHGWIESYYIIPKFHFKYYGFEFVQPWGEWIYLLFFICGLSAFLVAIGYKYRWAIIVFFLSFTYIELLDKTTYLNHYYFISILSFLMIFLPAGNYFSVDAYRKAERCFQKIPRYAIDAIILLLSIVYIHAGLAKLNPDWMLRAMPLKIWLTSNYDLPLVGSLLQKEWVHYAFSWAGALYDLTIVFFLLYRPTRIFAYITVIVFHLMTGLLFQIGMFPYIMILSTLIFFHADFHHKLLGGVARWLRIDKSRFDNDQTRAHDFSHQANWKATVVGLFFIIQLLLPWRFLAYPGKLFWTEQGFRFSWRVMLTEKTGYANFKIVDAKSGKRFYVNNRDFLNSFQEEQMSTKADFILEYAHYLGNHFASQGHQNVQVFVESYAALNGRRSQPFIDPTVDLMTIRESFKHKDWILPLHE